jgi:serine/threonine protein kinase
MRRIALFCFYATLLVRASLCASPSIEQRTQELFKIGEEVGLTRNDARAICQYMKKGSFERSKQHLPCEIRKFHSLPTVILRRLPRHSRIGEGCHKVVRKVIWYSAHPRIVAECDGDSTALHEIEVLRLFRGVRGIVSLLGSVERSKGKRYMMYQEYFSGGSLSKKISAKVAFSEVQILKIAKDVSNGLLAMHRKKIVHRDLHSGNILLRMDSDGLYEAALGDFGKAEFVAQVKGRVPQGAITSNPPETLKENWTRMDRFLTDVYALGCNFYSLVWKGPVPWAKAFNVYKMKKYSPEERQRRYETIVKLYSATKDRCVGQILRKKALGDQLTPFESFKVMIFEMIDFTPQHRPQMEIISKKLADIKS